MPTFKLASVMLKLPVLPVLELTMTITIAMTMAISVTICSVSVRAVRAMSYVGRTRKVVSRRQYRRYST
ncbi:hypothetical protein HID58_024267 [Brassica napus]|uniref:Uncharacterized protein n=1 Tax=Brassica napus TaxID=3708 RepID=A0ABQ8D6W7_BRANA|nr:hypothetical protein HID58_024267 [Brassica napus]